MITTTQIKCIIIYTRGRKKTNCNRTQVTPKNQIHAYGELKVVKRFKLKKKPLIKNRNRMKNIIPDIRQLHVYTVI